MAHNAPVANVPKVMPQAVPQPTYNNPAPAKKKEKKQIVKRVVEGKSEYDAMFLINDQYTKIRNGWKLVLDNVKLANVITQSKINVGYNRQ